MRRSKPVVALDVGNTSTKGALVGEGRVVFLLHVPTCPAGTLAARLAEGLAARGRDVPEGAGGVVSSVRPEANAAVQAFWEKCGRGEPLRFFGADLPVPIPTLVREPQKVGTDRLLCALGARMIAGAPCIAVAAGTAITVDLVDGRGRFAGGAIAPGFHLAARALHEGTSRLPLVSPSAPDRATGRDATEAIRSGVRAFCRGGVAALVSELTAEAGAPAPVVLTGGDAPLLLRLPVDAEVRHVPELLFLGMAEALRAENA